MISHWSLGLWQFLAGAGPAPTPSFSDGGVEVNHYTVKLANATISGIKSIPLNNKNPELTR